MTGGIALAGLADSVAEVWAAIQAGNFYLLPKSLGSELQHLPLQESLPDLHGAVISPPFLQRQPLFPSGGSKSRACRSRLVWIPCPSNPRRSHE